MSAATIRCQKSHYGEQWVVVFTDEYRGDNIQTLTDQSLSSLLRIADDRSRWATIAAEASVVGSPKRRLGVMGVSWIVRLVYTASVHCRCYEC